MLLNSVMVQLTDRIEIPASGTYLQLMYTYSDALHFAENFQVTLVRVSTIS